MFYIHVEFKLTLVLIAFNHNAAGIELQIRPSLFNKQECDTLVTTVLYRLMAPEGGYPTWEEHFIKNYQNAMSLFLSHTC